MANFKITSQNNSFEVEIDGKKAEFYIGDVLPYTPDGAGQEVFLYEVKGVFKATAKDTMSRDRIPIDLASDTIDVDGVTSFANADALMTALRAVFFFSVDSFKTSTFKITYYEIIDISATTSGSLQETPTGATINEGEFGESGNSILSTITASSQPSYATPLDALDEPITVNLDTNGNWVASDTYVDPVALIYSINIEGSSWAGVSLDNVIDFKTSKDLIWGSIRGSVINQIDLPEILSEGIWDYSASTTIADPGAGNVRLNNLDASLSNRAAISKTSNQGIAFGSLFGLVTNGSVLNLREYASVGQYAVSRVTGVIDNGTWLDVSYTVIEATGFSADGVDTIIRIFDLANVFGSATSRSLGRPSQTTEGLISLQDTFQTYLSKRLATKEAADYRIECSYQWSYDASNNDFLANLEVWDVTGTPNLYATLFEQVEEPKDSGGGGVVLNILSGGVISGSTNSGTNQRNVNGFSDVLTLQANRIYEIRLNWASGDDGPEATIYRANINYELKYQQ